MLTYKALIFFKTSQFQEYIYIQLCEVTEFQLICYSPIQSYLQIEILDWLYLFGIVP